MMRLTVDIQSGPHAGERYAATPGQAVVVGRYRPADVALPEDALVSNRHCEFVCTENGYQLRDLGSRFGTQLNGRPVTVAHLAQLANGDRVQVGNSVLLLRLRPTEQAMPTMAPRVLELSEPVKRAFDTMIRPKPAAPATSAAAAPGQKIVLPGQTPEGQHILGVLVKRTYTIVPGQPCVRADKDEKLVPGDVHYGDPMNSTVKYETDYFPFKLATDVVLNGNAYAPGGRPTPALTATLQVGQHRKDVRVVGDRVVRHNGSGSPTFTDPAPFTKMELRYERAYGGVDIYSDPKVPCVYARNHLGRGFAVTPAKRAVDNLPLPNLEDPSSLLTPDRLCPGHFMYWGKQPPPAGFGWYCRYWQPRASLAGVMPADREFEQAMRKAYATLLPAADRKSYTENKLPDMNFKFFNGASSGLVVPFLNGDEPVQLTNLTPEGGLAFLLPGDRPRIGLDIGAGAQEPPVVLHTLMIRPEDGQLDLVWRAAVPYEGPDWLPKMRKLEVSIQ